MSEIKQRAEQSRGKKAAFGRDLNLEDFSRQGGAWEYDPDYRQFSPEERSRLLTTGIELTDEDHAGTFLQADKAIVHCQTRQPGVEVLPITEAASRHDWVHDLLWGLVAVDADKYTAAAALELDNGYFIRALKGAQIAQPVESCLYIRSDRFAQHVHNLVVVEEGASLHIITGCATHPGVISGLHIGVSEFYVRRGGKLTFTMVHNWGEEVHVRPRTAVMVEAGGTYISNYLLLRPVKSVQMYPTVTLNGEGAVARMQSILIAHPGCELDVGGRVILKAPHTRAEVIARTLAIGGYSMARGHLVGPGAGHQGPPGMPGPHHGQRGGLRHSGIGRPGSRGGHVPRSRGGQDRRRGSGIPHGPGPGRRRGRVHHRPGLPQRQDRGPAPGLGGRNGTGHPGIGPGAVMAIKKPLVMSREHRWSLGRLNRAHVAKRQNVMANIFMIPSYERAGKSAAC